MNSLKRLNWTKYAMLVALAAAMASGLANAQDVQGKFNLPFTARWGATVLTPGHYSFTYDPTRSGSRVIKVDRGSRGIALILAGPYSEGQFSGPSHLTAVPMGNAYRITSLQLSEQGIKLNFAIPKGEVLEASQTNPGARTLPILRAAK